MTPLQMFSLTAVVKKDYTETMEKTLSLMQELAP